MWMMVAGLAMSRASGDRLMLGRDSPAPLSPSDLSIHADQRRVVTVGNELRANGVDARSQFGQWVMIENVVAIAPGAITVAQQSVIGVIIL
ncbi:hypothetical protein TIFTF001_016055 [Ficus carica]|uniref:Uncharacterized protein n=1 Tax=Ficus carica TaxID=3494 RepID=A0AA87ZZP2_FICCA|nr:hypothetical protein TIFTF001_016055 [Ficus carica]